MTNVLLEKKGPYAVATIHRPEALNALNSQVLADLPELLDTVEADEEIRALVITGAGEKAFVAGADIGEMSTLTKAEGEAFGKKGNDVFRRLETLPIPIERPARHGFDACATLDEVYTVFVASRRPVWVSPPASAAPSGWPVWLAPVWPSS